MPNTHRGALVLATASATIPKTTATAPRAERPSRPPAPVLRPGKVRTVKVRNGDQVRLGLPSPVRPR